jgi:hypothetical protein
MHLVAFLGESLAHFHHLQAVGRGGGRGGGGEVRYLHFFPIASR